MEAKKQFSQCQGQKRNTLVGRMLAIKIVNLGWKNSRKRRLELPNVKTFGKLCGNNYISNK